MRSTTAPTPGPASARRATPVLKPPARIAADASAFPEVAPTSERSWLEVVAGLPLLELPALTAVTIVSPHPDDETLAAGGLIFALRSLGVAVQVLAVTDGEGSHPGHPALAAVRCAEQSEALDRLGVDTAPVRLGFADGAVAAGEAGLVDAIERHSSNAELIVAPWKGDGHTDHGACGRAALEAARRTGADVLAYPVWAWQWAHPADLAVLPMRRHELDEGAHEAKLSAMRCYPSQTTGAFGAVILDEGVLARFRRRSEVFVDAR